MKWYQMQWAQKYWGTAARKRYQRYLQFDAWKTKRNAVLHAASFRCRWCSARATEVQDLQTYLFGFPFSVLYSSLSWQVGVFSGYPSV